MPGVNLAFLDRSSISGLRAGVVPRRRREPSRRDVLALLGALPVAGIGVPSRAQARHLEMSSYFHGEPLAVAGAQLFADRATAASAGAMQVSLEVILPWMPLGLMSGAAAFAHYCAPDFADVEPLLGLSALPMLAATLDEAETLLRIARPCYSAALARHGQLLLATQPWRPVALWSTFRIRSVADLQGTLFPLLSHGGEAAGWGSTFVRLGSRRGSYSDAEFNLSSGYTANMKLTQEFAYFTEIFLAAKLNFLTVSRQVFDSLPKAQADILVEVGRTTELSQWRQAREFMQSDHREIAARGVSVVAKAPADVMETLRVAAEPDIQSWARSVGHDGTDILRTYRSAIGRQ